MCGIFGLVGDVSPEMASQCLQTLQHRGPDGSGLWHQPEVCLGHTRLSILDLSEKGAQPMQYANGRYCITFNGEIYNFLEIRKQLESKGYDFFSDTDTEVILAAYMEWGENCLSMFNGMWAFAVWDASERRLFLARDRFGIKPLFYTTLSDGNFAFASEMKALFPLLDDIRPNAELVSDHARIFSYEATEECVIEGIKRFPIGHYGYFHNGKLDTRRWWCTLDHPSDIPDSYEEQVEQFRELFLDACRLRMRSDVPIGTALSGGLDSSATISAMAHIASHGQTERMGVDWQHAFVASFPGTPLDEAAYAKMVSDHIGIDTTVIEIDPTQSVAEIDKYFYLFEDLYITSPIPFMQTYGAVKAHGIAVTIDGHGADELFGGYPFDYFNALLDAGLNTRHIRDVVETYYQSWPEGHAQFNRLPSKLRFWLEWRARHAAKKLLRPKKHYPDHQHQAWPGLDRLSQALYESTHYTVLPTLLRNYDRYSMANGVEIRMPFMDYRVVSFAFSLPWNSKLRRRFTKTIVRDAMAKFMPDEIAFRRAKIGFNSPIVDWMKGPLREFLLDTIASHSFKRCELIDPDSVSEMVRGVINNPRAQFTDGEKAWTMLTPYLWEKAVVRGGGLHP